MNVAYLSQYHSPSICQLLHVAIVICSLAIASCVHKQYDFVLLLFIVTDEVRKVFPGGFEATVMKQRMNQGFMEKKLT